MEKTKKYYHIYNMVQCDFYIKNGVMPVGAGVGAKGDAYLLFMAAPKQQEVYERWCKICREGQE